MGVATLYVATLTRSNFDPVATLTRSNFEISNFVPVPPSLSLAPPDFLALNVYTGQIPRQHVILIEIQPNAYNYYLSAMAGVILTFFGVIYFG